MPGIVPACMVCLVLMVALLGGATRGFVGLAEDVDATGTRVERSFRADLREDREAREGDVQAIYVGDRASVVARRDEAFAQSAGFVVGALRRSVAVSEANTERVRSMLDGVRSWPGAAADSWARRRITLGMMAANGSTSATMSQVEAARDSFEGRIGALQQTTDKTLASCDAQRARGDLADAAGCDEVRAAARDFADAREALSSAYDDAIQAARNNASAQAEMIEAARE